MRNTIKTLSLVLVMTAGTLFTSLSAYADTYVQQFAYEGHDGNRITGFIYQKADTKKDAPLAILMHGLTGSSLYWLAAHNMTYGAELTDMLLQKGYRIIALDARSHGARKDDMKPMIRVKAARKGKSAPYQAMIKNTVLDYNFIVNKVKKNFTDPKHILVLGYSMGAQMGVLFTAQNEDVAYLATMIPPAVNNVPEVAPVNHATNVKVPWLLMTANKDQFSTKKQNDALAAAAAGPITHIKFDSGHGLPKDYLSTIDTWMKNTIK